MPRARSQIQEDWQTAAPEESGSGCLSVYSLSILGVFLITGLITILGLRAPIIRSSSTLSVSVSSTNITNASNFTNTALSPIFTREVQYWGNHISKWAATASIDPNLVAVVMQIESCGDPRALSRS